MRSITISNFQKHKFIELNLVDGINAIIGPSDSGKTSIIRALKWLINNTPQGFAFKHIPSLSRSDEPSNNQATVVSVDFGDATVSRIRDNKSNGYVLGDKEFEATKGQVPEEVRDFINIPYYCFQEQHNPHFLLTDSPGEVSSKINALIGLDKIDETIKKINQIVNEAKDNSNQSLNDIKLLEEKISSLSFLDESGKLIERLEELESKKEKLHLDLTKIESSLEDIGELDEIIGELIQYRDISAKIDEMTERVSECKNIEEDIDELESSLRYLNKLDISIKNLNRFRNLSESLEQISQRCLEADSISKDIVGLESVIFNLNRIDEKIGKYVYLEDIFQMIPAISSDIEKYESLKGDIKKLSGYIGDIVSVDDDISSLGKEIDSKMNKFNKIMAQNKVCPLCGRVI